MAFWDSVFTRLGMRTNTPAQVTSEQAPLSNPEGAVAQNLGTPPSETRIMPSITMDSSENPAGSPPPTETQTPPHTEQVQGVPAVPEVPAVQAPNPVEGTTQPPIPSAEGGIKPV